MTTVRLLKEFNQAAGWGAMPLDIKKITGAYLLKEGVLKGTPLAKEELDILLSDRINIDLPYRPPVEELKESSHPTLYCKLVSYVCSHPPAARDGCLEYLSWATIICICIPVSAVTASIGMCVAGGKAIKKCCENSSEEVFENDLEDAREEELHRYIIGSPRQR